jgi:hypothetical protein
MLESVRKTCVLQTERSECEENLQILMLSVSNEFLLRAGKKEINYWNALASESN